MGGPLDRTGGDMKAESDVIFTAVTLGFALTRAVLKQPFSFDVEPDSTPEDKERLSAAVLSVVRTLEGLPGLAEASHTIKVGFSPKHGGVEASLITGCPGGDHLTPEQRLRAFEDDNAWAMGLWEYRSAEPGAEQFAGQYHGPGAYTGMIGDPVGRHTLIQPTLRRVIADPARWSPCPHDVWGLIGTENKCGATGPNLSPDPSVGMGPLRQGRGIVQYVHGMSWAMREAVRWGPWVTAYEMAVGGKTRKRASCFACTTYMWASGFPPSSTHLGRCESWGVLPDGSFSEGEDHVFSDGAEGLLEKAIARSLNVRWHTQIYHFLRQGSALLERRFIGGRGLHAEAARRLSARLEIAGPADALTGGNLFLDAITVHGNDAQRVVATLGSS